MIDEEFDRTRLADFSCRMFNQTYILVGDWQNRDGYAFGSHKFDNELTAIPTAIYDGTSIAFLQVFFFDVVS